MTIVVRDADAADEATLLGFLRDLQDAERALCASRRPGHEVDRCCYDCLLKVGAHILLAEDEGRAVGFIAGRLKVDDDALQVAAWPLHGHVSDLFVLPEYRGHGVAQRLLQAMVDQLRGEGAGRVRIGALSANRAAITAYERFGFEPFEVLLDMNLA